MNKLVVGTFALLFLYGCSYINLSNNSYQDLSGNWNYKLDTSAIGEDEAWYTKKFSDSIKLPGALRDYGIGEEPDVNTKWTGSIYDSSWYFNPAMRKYREKGNIKFPFWLTPDKHYVGTVWYQKEIEIPKDWVEKDLKLYLERPHWQTTVWLDSLKIGSDNSLSVPHQFIIPAKAISKAKHWLTIKVDNAIRTIDPGINSHSITDHTQGNWNGMVGAITLMPVAKIFIKKLKIVPNLKDNLVDVHIKLNEPLAHATIAFNINGANHEHKLEEINKNWTGGDEAKYSIAMGDNYKKWSEFQPNFYELSVSLENNDSILDKKTAVFGMRAFTVDKNRFQINGTTVFLRGTTECAVFPLTGYPPTSEEEWSEIYRIAKSFGLNHIRFHSYCPPEAAFIAADKVGFYLQIEGPSWAKYSTSLGDGTPIDDYLMKETKRIIDTYGNHPSFVMMSYGNEPSGNYVPYLENWVEHFREYDSQRLFTGASTGRSWAIIQNSDFIVRSPPRGLEWKDKQPNSTFDYRDKTEGQEKPYVTFEMGQWCVFPNFDEIEKYTGSLKARNFELFQEDLADHHMESLANQFLMASGKLQASCYKQEIEATLRTPNLAGFQLLGLTDFPGQGTALVGVLDAFWDEKPYISADEFSAFNASVVPLIRLEKFTFIDTAHVSIPVEVANFSGNVLNGELNWKIRSEENILKQGTFKRKSIPIGTNNSIGTIETTLDFVKKAQKLTIEVSVGKFKNQWNIWVYPDKQIATEESDIIIATEVNDKVRKALNDGQSVLLLASGHVENGKDVVQYLVPAFWNTSWFRMRPPHTTGIYIRDTHPVFKDFPTDYYSDLQWWEIANKQQVMNLENFDPSFTPIIQPIDTWFLNRRLSMLFEAKVAKGKLMVCSIDLENDMNERIVARQLKLSILNYMNSEDFNPEAKVKWEIISELFEKKEREGWKSYVKNTP
ncbi:glycoside hydrolase family 2 TIM barrel-domain containing protein [Zunongwangia pacifica]|uniref:beta-galactosidase n=1 Tax=Zunongwangia pacifica TaxID=2911062 RepID=A0A9X1ZYX2_9FLAO|nr:glycoside hydrolase family 2 TIM barrel-domain containing protein [Zunongwangia pacifica]MCL6220253.1 beta-glucuronidase [Zunongwangia pacifica]